MKKQLLMLATATTLFTACSGPSPTSPMSLMTSLSTSGSVSAGAKARPMVGSTTFGSPAPTSAPTSAPTAAPSAAATTDSMQAMVPIAMASATTAPTPAIVATPAPIPAGQLTAGQWSDLNNWLFWQDLSQGDWKEYLNTWGLNTKFRYPVVVKFGDKPAVDVPVQLLNNEGKVLYAARTDNQGKAYLFGNLTVATDQQPSTTGWKIAVNEQRQNLSSIQEYAFNLDAAQPTANQLDVMFMVDTTGSMGDELEYLKTELGSVITRVRQETQVNIRQSGGYYRDQGDEYVVKSFPFTTQSDQMLSEMRLFSADGGGDFPEAVDMALEAAANHSWSTSAKARLLFLVLDAPPHEGSAYQARLNIAMLQAAQKGVRIIPIASSGIDKPTESLLRVMAIATGGKYVFLTDDSGIGESHLKPTIGPHKVEKLNDLLVGLIQDYLK